MAGSLLGGSTQNRFKPEYLKYLMLSYQLGRNEAWVALKRNPVALTDFERLPPDVAKDAIDEFLALINNELYQQAVEILAGRLAAGTVIPHLATLPHRNREAFARAVYNRGLDVKIPGIEPPNSKPGF